MKARLLHIIYNKIYQRTNHFVRTKSKTKPQITIETLGHKTGAGVRNFMRLMNKFRRWGWNVALNKGYDHAEFVIIHFRPIPNYEEYFDKIKSAKKNGSKILLYLIEPLDLRTETWTDNLAPIHIVLETLDLCDAIIVNSIGYLYSSQYIELNAFSAYLSKTVLIEESLLEELYGNLPIKQHKTQTPVAVWHGYTTNLSRWVKGDWPGNLNLDPKQYPSVYEKNESEKYGNLYNVLDIPLITIAKYHPEIKVDKIYPGERSIGKMLQDFDIGIAPFYTNIYRTLNKPFGAKIQTYMIVGLPVIASPIPDYKRWIEHEKTGLFADSAKEWKDASKQLKDPKLRQKIADNARSMVLINFSPDRIIGKFESLLYSLMKKEENLPFLITNY